MGEVIPSSGSQGVVRQLVLVDMVVGLAGITTSWAIVVKAKYPSGNV